MNLIIKDVKKNFDKKQSIKRMCLFGDLGKCSAPCVGNVSNDEYLKIIDDVNGLEICGIIKNINAIANGICEGMNINENARYAILTKGFEETQKIVEAIGGDPSTVKEYCGFGDLVLTSTSNESRNHTLGMLYGQRIIVDEDASGIVVEGKKSIKAIRDICEKTDTESIVVDFVYDVVVNKDGKTL